MVARPTHTCAALCCSRKVATHLLMCIDHWRLVPAPLQRRVNGTWATLNGARSPAESAGAHSDYLVARSDAIAAVTRKLEAQARDRAGGSASLFS